MNAARALLAAGLAALALAGPAASARAPAAPAPLPALALDAQSVTVSGLSSGAYMAGQFHVAFSASLAGAGLLAGGPYGCSRGALATALTACSCPPATSAWQAWLQRLPLTGCAVPSPSVLASFADEALARLRGEVDDPAALARQRVWLLTGAKDTVVNPALVDAAADFYRRRGLPAALLHVERVPGAAHGLPVPDGPVACGVVASPYLLRCGPEDAAGALLAWLYAPPGLPPLAAASPRAAGWRRFDQRPYRQPAFDGLDDSGWLYLPQACERAGAAGGTACRLHVVFHGCAQGQGYAPPGGAPIGQRFVAGSGYARWAEGSRIVLLFPQVKASTLPAAQVLTGRQYRFNPDGCWDFWGYTDPDGDLRGIERRFMRRDAPQLRAVKAMVDALLAVPGR